MTPAELENCVLDANEIGDPPIVRERRVLLPMPASHGTLAAVRCLGAAGISVTVADGNPLVPAVWSRFAGRRVRGPDPSNPSRFIHWLREFCAPGPGYVVLPAHGDLGRAYSLRPAPLAEHLQLPHSPPAVS